jgi:hypothetical protein
MAVTGILGKKIGMTQVFDEKGDVHPITVLQAGPCVITQLKTAAKDGYDAAQIGLVEFVKASRMTKAQNGHLKKTEAPPVKVIKEVDVEAATDGAAETKAGDRVLVDIFRCEVRGRDRHFEGPRVCGRGAPAQVSAAVPSRTGTCSRCRARSALRAFRRGFSRAAHARPHGNGPGDGAQPAHSRHRSWTRTC